MGDKKTFVIVGEKYRSVEPRDLGRIVEVVDYQAAYGNVQVKAPASGRVCWIKLSRLLDRSRFEFYEPAPQAAEPTPA